MCSKKRKAKREVNKNSQILGKIALAEQHYLNSSLTKLEICKVVGISYSCLNKHFQKLNLQRDDDVKFISKISTEKIDRVMVLSKFGDYSLSEISSEVNLTKKEISLILKLKGSHGKGNPK